MTSIHSISLSIEQQQQSSSRYSQPPPYLTNDNATIEQQAQYEQEHHQRRHKKKRRLCSLCHHHDPPPTTRKHLSKYNPSALAMKGPYLVQHHDRVYWITTCYCDKNNVHALCLSMSLMKKTTLDTMEEGHKQQQQLQKDPQSSLTCASCHYYYRTGWRLGWLRLMICCSHFLSLASVIGLVYGLSFLGRSLDELGLGNEMGAKLDGDENWQDHEMQEIADWLNLVHLVTALAGEALLGLVYVVGVCGVIGPCRTVHMIYAILYLDLTPILFTNNKGSGDNGGSSDSNGSDYEQQQTLSTMSTWCHYFLLWFGLSWFGLIFGTWLLFYSWVWACIFHFLCRRILDVRKPTNTSPSLTPSSP